MEVGGVVGEAEQRLCPQHAYHDSRLRQPEANNADPAPAQMKLENDERQEDEGCEEQNAYDEYDEEEEEEEEVIMDEEELLRMLDKMEPPLSVCQRLLKGVPTTRYNDGNRIRCIPKQQDKQENTPAWRVLSASQRESLSRRGFTIVDDIAPLDLVAEAYDEALARASAGSLTPAHGGAVGGGTESEGNDSADGEQGVTGYVKSVRDDLTAFVSVEGESAAGGSGTSGPVEEGQHEVLADGGKGEGVNPAGTGAIGQTLGLLAGLGEDIERMVRLKGRVEHQLAVYPAGIRARYERHRDAYPDDGMESEGYDAEDEAEDHLAEKNSGSGHIGSGEGIDKVKTPADSTRSTTGGSVSFRRVTAICYLRGSNSPWATSDGGVLRLYPPATGSGQGGGGGGDINVSSSTKEVGDGHSHGGPEREQAGVAPLCHGDLIAPHKVAGAVTSRATRGGSASVVDHGEDTHDGPTEAVSGAFPVESVGSVFSDPSVCSPVSNLGECKVSSETEKKKEGEKEEERYIDVAPLAGRAVVFFSGAVEHEVLPVTGESPRAALTTWFH